MAQSFKVLKRVQDKDPMFIRKVFVSHYCNVPFHLLDKETAKNVKEKGVYPQCLVEELYAASFHLIRNFELSPFANDTTLEDMVATMVEQGKI